MSHYPPTEPPHPKGRGLPWVRFLGHVLTFHHSAYKHIYAMKRTTIFVDDEVFVSLKRIAKEEGKTRWEIIRQALQKFIDERYTARRSISFIGVGRSGHKDISERSERLFWRVL